MLESPNVLFSFRGLFFENLGDKLVCLNGVKPQRADFFYGIEPLLGRELQKRAGLSFVKPKTQRESFFLICEAKKAELVRDSGLRDSETVCAVLLRDSVVVNKALDG
jgi:hypothetical protein